MSEVYLSNFKEFCTLVWFNWRVKL